MDISAKVKMPDDISFTVESTMTVSEWQKLRDSIASIAGSGVEIGQFYAAINKAVEDALNKIKT